MDHEKIEAIMGWPSPNNVLEVRSFMGLVCNYMIFIDGFSKVEYLITSLQRKGVKFQWALRCEESFIQLKSLF